MKYRSYLNHHFPADDQTVAFVPFAEIEWVREHRITSTVPGGTRGDDTSYRYRYAEFKVPESLATELGKHVDAEMRQVESEAGTTPVGAYRDRRSYQRGESCETSL